MNIDAWIFWGTTYGLIAFGIGKFIQAYR
jgi:hypothetical protein